MTQYNFEKSLINQIIKKHWNNTAFYKVDMNKKKI